MIFKGLRVFCILTGVWCVRRRNGSKPLLTTEKGLIIIIQVSKEEAQAIRENCKDPQIVRTCVQKSNRHRYYAVESREVKALLRKMRGAANVK